MFTPFAEIGTIKKLFPLVRHHRWRFSTIVVIGLLQSLSEGIGIGLFIPLLDLLVSRPQVRPKGHWVTRMVQDVFGGATPEHQLALVVVCLFAAVFTSALLAYLHGVLSASLYGLVGHQLRRTVFGQLLRANFGFIERDHSGHLLHVLTTETWYTVEALRMLVRVAIMATTIIVYVALLLLMSWQLTFAVAVAFTVSSTVIRMCTRRVREFGEQATQSSSKLADVMVEGIDGMRVIRAYGREQHEQRRFDEHSDRVRGSFLRMHFLEEAVHPLHDLFAATILLIILFVTARTGGDVSGLLAFVFVLYRLQPRVKDLDGTLVRLAALTPSIEQVRQLLETTARNYLTSGSVPQLGMKRSIGFDRVSFRYATGEEAVLSDASFTIRAGETTALVGLSGGGKSTAIKLILRFEDPISGTIFVDGRPLPDFDLDSWRSRIALVSQDVFLFNATVRDNIAYGRLDATFDDVVEAARQADAHDFIERLPAKYDTLLGPRGVRLSSGQQQRIALARALIRNPLILILDEATNAVDRLSERWIQQTLEKLRRHRTVVVIAHRLSTIEYADQVIVLDKGKVREQGTLTALAEANGLFSRLFRPHHRLTAHHHG